jgi:hypothetical protein
VRHTAPFYILGELRNLFMARDPAAFTARKRSFRLADCG